LPTELWKHTNFKIIHNNRGLQIGMKRIYAYILLILFCISAISASAADSIVTVYKDGEFVSQYQRLIKTTPAITASVTDDLITEFNNSPGKLFDWALKDLGVQDQKKGNEVIIVFKKSTVNEKTGISEGVFDIVVPGITTFNNVRVDGSVTKAHLVNGATRLTAIITYSSLLVKNASATVTIIPQKNNEQLFVSNLKIRFGWFFNIFITKKRYQSIVEWRIKKFTENMRIECEKREKQ
jgi:hypothetical protein